MPGVEGLNTDGRFGILDRTGPGYHAGMAVESAAGAAETTEVPVRIVDCDVHPFGDTREVAEYVPEP